MSITRKTGFVTEISPAGGAAREKLQGAVVIGGSVMVQGDGFRRHLKVRYDQRNGEYTVRVGKRGQIVERLVGFERTTMGSEVIWVFCYRAEVA